MSETAMWTTGLRWRIGGRLLATLHRGGRKRSRYWKAAYGRFYAMGKKQ